MCPYGLLQSDLQGSAWGVKPDQVRILGTHPCGMLHSWWMDKAPRAGEAILHERGYMRRRSYKGIGIRVDVYELDNGGFTGDFWLVRKLPDSDEETRYVLQECFTTRDLAEAAALDQARKIILR